MARRTFFSFHYERDVWRATVVRNSWVTQPDRQAAGFFDASLWEESKKRGDAAIRKLIDEGLMNTSVTVVLVGAETASRPYVQYEIQQSIARGNGLLAVRIHGIRTAAGHTDWPGVNPLSSQYRIYDWAVDDGYSRLGTWIESAAKQAGR